MAHDLDYLGLPIRSGQRLTIPEADYMFGEGPITIDVISLGDVAEYGGIVWVVVKGNQIFSNGSEPRTICVRLEALRAVRGAA